MPPWTTDTPRRPTPTPLMTSDCSGMSLGRCLITLRGAAARVLPGWEDFPPLRAIPMRCTRLPTTVTTVNYLKTRRGSREVSPATSSPKSTTRMLRAPRIVRALFLENLQRCPTGRKPRVFGHISRRTRTLKLNTITLRTYPDPLTSANIKSISAGTYRRWSAVLTTASDQIRLRWLAYRLKRKQLKTAAPRLWLRDLTTVLRTPIRTQS